MDTFVIDYVLERLFNVRKPIGCYRRCRRVYRVQLQDVDGNVLPATASRGLRECNIRECGQVYVAYAERCLECRRGHCRAVANDHPRALRYPTCDRERAAVNTADASTNTEPAATLIDTADAATQCSTVVGADAVTAGGEACSTSDTVPSVLTATTVHGDHPGTADRGNTTRVNTGDYETAINHTTEKPAHYEELINVQSKYNTPESNQSSNTRQFQSSNTENPKALPILQNGSLPTLSGGMRICAVKQFGKVILANTCAFDSVTSILMVAYSDSIEYNTKVDGFDNVFMRFIAEIVKYGITKKTYWTRAKILINYLQPNLEYLDNYDVTLATCETTVGNVLKTLLIKLPTILDNVKCTIPTCKANTIPLSYMTIIVMNGNLNALEEDVKARLMVETSPCRNVNKKGETCKGRKSIQPIASAVHLFIELLNIGDETEYVVSDVAQQVVICLENVPPIIKLDSIQYHLRGICSHGYGRSEGIDAIGHYRSYCKRNGRRNWELYDDLNSKPIPVQPQTKIPCELLIYSI